MKLSETTKILQKLSNVDLNSLTGAKKIQILKEMGYVDQSFYSEIEMDSPYVNTHCDISRSADSVELHSHTFYEILYVKSGSLQYLLGTDRYYIQSGDILIIPPALSHQPLFLNKLVEPYERYVLWISPAYMDKLEKDYPGFKRFRQYHLLRTSGKQKEEFKKEFLHGIQEENSSRYLSQAMLQSNTTVLLVNLVRSLMDQSIASPDAEKEEQVDACIKYIEEHLNDKLTLETIAKAMNVSESTISHLFQKKLKVSFYRFVTRRRLIAAKNLIQQNELLENVADMTGFSDYSSFFRAFRQEFGITPKQYSLMNK